MATSVRIPLQLMTVNLSNANAFWQAKDGTNFDYGYVAYLDNVDGISYWWGIVPKNLSATANWTLIIHHGANAGSGGNVILNVSALDFADGATIDAALTVLETGRSLATGTSGLMQIDNLATTGASIFDADEAITASNFLVVAITRDGDNASDTVADQWNLFSVILECDVN